MNSKGQIKIKTVKYFKVLIFFEVVEMVEYFEVRKLEVGKVGAEKELVNAWMDNLHALENAHPRVFRKVMKEILAYTGEKELNQALNKLAGELLERHKKNKKLQSVKMALTYKKYLYFNYGSLVKLYLDGTVVYNPRATIEGYGFVIHAGDEVA